MKTTTMKVVNIMQTPIFLTVMEYYIIALLHHINTVRPINLHLNRIDHDHSINLKIAKPYK